MDLIEQFYDDELNPKLDFYYVAENFYERFVKEYPVDKILSLKMEQFLFAPKDFGFEESFCYQLMYSPIASMGNAFPSVFGIYNKEGTQIVLSPTYLNNDVGKAFELIKKDIVNLLEDAKNDDYKKISDNPLNSMFKNILLAVYFPQKYIPAPTKTAVRAYAEALELEFDPKSSLQKINHDLVNWKDANEMIKEWDSFTLMRFCDWLWKKGITIKGNVHPHPRSSKKHLVLGDDSIGKFSSITKYLEFFRKDDIPNDVLNDFYLALIEFCNSHVEYKHEEYQHNLYTYGILWDLDAMSEKSVDNIDDICLINLLIATFEAEKKCEGSLQFLLNNGSVVKWLEQLESYDTSLLV